MLLSLIGAGTSGLCQMLLAPTLLSLSHPAFVNCQATGTGPGPGIGDGDGVPGDDSIMPEYLNTCKLQGGNQ